MATLLQKAKLLKGLCTGKVACIGPFYVTVDVTRRCNLRCVGCRYHSTQINIPSPSDQTILDISFEMVEKLCEELPAMGVNSLTVMAEGEPFLYPYFFDLISKAKVSGLHVTVITNGTFLDEANVRSLIDLKLNILRVSLWASSSDKESQQNYSGLNPDHFKTIAEGLKCLSTLKVEKKSQFPWVILHQPINRYNLKNIEAMIDLAQRTQCNALSFGPFLSHRGKLAQLALSQSEEKLLFTSLTKMGKRLNSISMHHNINKTLKRYRIGEAVWDKFPCYIGWLHARIKVDGTVFPCGPYNLPLGHLKKNSLHEIWNGPGYQTFRQQTLSREGLASIGEDSDCGFCCLLEDNIRVYRIFRFFSPFLPWLKKSKNRFKGDVLK